MKQTSLVIMAAGIGSRFGKGIKQLEPDLLDKSGTLDMKNYTDESTHISLESNRQ